MNQIFQAGIYSTSGELSAPSEGANCLPFINNIDKYTITVTPPAGEANINAKIKLVTPQKVVGNNFIIFQVLSTKIRFNNIKIN